MSVEQICTIIAALMLASCVRLHAQFGVEQPMFAMQSTVVAEPPSPKTLIPGLEYWWVATDLTNGATVTNWYDRLQNFPLQNGNASVRPTNSSDGVCFLANKFLTNSLLGNTPISRSHFVIIKPTSRTAVYDNYAGDNSSFYGFTRNTFRGWYAGWAGNNENLSGLDVGTNVWMTLTISEPTTTGNHTAYTNGVASVGVAYATWGLPQFNSLGGGPAIGWYFDGYIREYGIITNTVSTATASNIYWYSTNTYGL